MKLLLHICCAPCAVYPLRLLRDRAVEVTGFFFNPNIHPFQEFRRRLTTLEAFAARENLRVEYQREYQMKEFLRQVVGREEKRCAICFETRLHATALTAREHGADAFTSTLLYSRMQNHELVRATGERVAREVGIPFLYEDWRCGWQEGIDGAKALGLYRQPYCGCIYSEQERYDNRLKKRLRKERKLKNEANREAGG